MLKSNDKGKFFLRILFATICIMNFMYNLIHKFNKCIYLYQDKLHFAKIEPI